MCSVAHWTAAQVTTHRLGDFYLSHLTQLVINSVCKELELSTSQTRHGPCVSPEQMWVWPLTWTFPELPKTSSHIWSGAHVVLEKSLYKLSWAHVTNGSRRETRVCLFRGGTGTGQQRAVPPVPAPRGLSRCRRHWCIWGALEPKKWMCIELCFHIGSNKQKKTPQKNTGQKEPGKGKKSAHYPQNVFLNIWFSCAAVWPDSPIEE